MQGVEKNIKLGGVEERKRNDKLYKKRVLKQN